MIQLTNTPIKCMNLQLCMLMDSLTKIFLNILKQTCQKLVVFTRYLKSATKTTQVDQQCRHRTEDISEFVDFHLRIHVENLPSHIKDTVDYLNKMTSMNPLPQNTILVSMDVSSLYSNIPHVDDIAACKEVWEQRSGKYPA